MKFCYVLLVISFSATNSVTQSSNKLKYYLNLIETESSRAYKGQTKDNAYEHIPKTNKWNEYGIFDHIIVGAGSAGAVLANRLSEDGRKNVLLLEAGHEPAEITNIPGMAAVAVGLEQNWNYSSTPQTTSCLGMINKRCAIPRGKALGGSSTLNALIFTRGNKADYDEWCRQGNSGWCYKDLYPLFKEMETFLPGDEKYRGKNGLLSVEYSGINEPISKSFLDANKELGENVIDYNSENQIGVGISQLNTLNGTRHSTYYAFLKPILNRPNLMILKNSFVIRVLIGKQKRAFAVMFSKNKKLYIARSRSDIILSAGTIGSAQILMLSGVGPKQHLKEMRIPVIQDLPVGSNLEDHVYLSNFQFLTNYSVPLLSMEKLVEQYLQSSGLLTNPFNAESLAFYRTKLNTKSYPDIEIALAPPPSVNPIISKFFNLDDETTKLVEANNDQTQRLFTMYVVLLHPKSKGTIRLKSSNPFEYPLIDLNLLSDPKNIDMETMYQGVQIALNLSRSDAFAKLDTKLRNIPHPNCKQHMYLSREFWYCQIRHFSTSLYHMIASCPMGPHPSKGAVVSPELKVFGIQNLRVADASIMPSSISGHTNGPSIMIGEKAAQLILKKSNT